MEELQVDFIGLSPTQANPGDAGLDLYAAHDAEISDSGVVTVGTGTRVAIPDGYYGMLAIRSSLGSSGVNLANAPGIIDSQYRGEIKLKLVHQLTFGRHKISEGERVAQLVITPIPSVSLKRVTAFDVTIRGEGGFGSSGR